MPTYQADLLKVSNSYDKFRQTVGVVLGNEGFLTENSGRNQWPSPRQATYAKAKRTDMSWIL